MQYRWGIRSPTYVAFDIELHHFIHNINPILNDSYNFLMKIKYSFEINFSLLLLIFQKISFQETEFKKI